MGGGLLGGMRMGYLSVVVEFEAAWWMLCLRS
jgi:hypothetical protein